MREVTRSMLFLSIDLTRTRTHIFYNDFKPPVAYTLSRSGTSCGGLDSNNVKNDYELEA